MDIEVVWNFIVKNEEEKFYTVGKRIEFVYSVDNNRIQPRPVNGSKIQGISKRTIEDVLKKHWPLNSTTQISKIYRASSYIFAILMDKRII